MSMCAAMGAKAMANFPTSILGPGTWELARSDAFEGKAPKGGGILPHHFMRQSIRRLSHGRFCHFKDFKVIEKVEWILGCFWNIGFILISYIPYKKKKEKLLRIGDCWLPHVSTKRGRHQIGVDGSPANGLASPSSWRRLLRFAVAC